MTRRPFLAPDQLDTTGCEHDWLPLHPSCTDRSPSMSGVVWSCRFCRSLAGTEVAMRSPITAARWSS